jgi:hypothetical protein
MRRSPIPLTAGVACSWIIASAGVAVATKYVTMASTTRAAHHLGVDDRVDDILKHPAFAAFGRLILPWDDGRNGFSGDSFGSGNLLLSGTFSTLIATCQKMANLMEKHGIKHLYPGHFNGRNFETKQRLDDEVTISKDVSAGR